MPLSAWASGEILKWTVGGFGFIRRDDLGPNLFAHYTSLRSRADPKAVGLVRGQRVEYELSVDETGREAATTVTAPGGGFVDDDEWLPNDSRSGAATSAGGPVPAVPAAVPALPSADAKRTLAFRPRALTTRRPPVAARPTPGAQRAADGSIVNAAAQAAQASAAAQASTRVPPIAASGTRAPGRLDEGVDCDGTKPRKTKRERPKPEAAAAATHVAEPTGAKRTKRAKG